MKKSAKQMALEIKSLLAKEEEKVNREFLNRVEATYGLYISSKR